MLLKQQPQIKLAFLPTPLQALPRLTNTLGGPQLLIKRDDQTGLALGGNKTRKLEYLFGDALKQNIDTIITAGAIQSNHCRQTAAAAAQMGLRCELLLNGKPPKLFEGNVLLNHLLGAHLHWKDEKTAPASLEALATLISAAGHKPYVIPYGGSNAFGTLGYINAMAELMEQQKTLSQIITHILFASCSGATHVGLVIGAKLFGFSGKIIGISVDYDNSKKSQFQKQLVDLAYATAALLGLDMLLNNEDFIVNYDYAVGYGLVGELERNAIRCLARQEGVLLDPVYTGRAFGAQLDMIKNGSFSKADRVLFWHTGGSPALFPYASELLSE